MTPLNRFIFQTFCLFLTCTPNFLWGQTQFANLDSFNSSLYHKFGNGSGIDRVFKVLELANGKILVGGTFEEVNGFPAYGIARLNADGSFDHTFHSGFSDASNVKALVELPSGKILVGGHFNSYDGGSCGNFVVLNANGTRDMTYTGVGNTGSYTEINDIQLAPGNQVIIAGYFGNFNGVLRNGLVRLTSSLQVDTSFGTSYSGSSVGEFYTVLTFPDGGILVGGDFENYWGNSASGLIKLTATGTYDPNFNLYTPGGFNASINKLKFTADGKILMCGRFTSYGGHQTYNIVRLNSNGAVDNTFQNSTLMSSGAIGDCIDFNGHVIVVGGLDFQGVNLRNMAYLSDSGSLLIGLSESLKCDSDDTIDLVEKLADGSILIGGNFYKILGKYSRSLIKFTDITTIERDFFTPPASDDHTAHNFSGNGSVRSISKYFNSHYLVSGRFTQFNGDTINGLARLDSDGELDPTFNAHFPAGVIITAFTVQQDGKVLVNYQNNNQDYTPKLVRLHTDGSLDSSFSCPLHYVVTRILLSNSNTRIIIAGYDQSSPNKAVNKLNLDGTLDPAFTPYSTIDMLDIIELSNGKILVEERWGGVTKISATGISDPSFNNSFSLFSTPATGFALQSDGKILLSGSGGNRIYRLNANGTTDATYQSEYYVTANYQDPNAIELQPDGKLLVYGNQEVFRFNMDGSHDPSFKQLKVTGGYVSDFLLDSNRLLIAGDYTYVNGFPINDLMGVDFSNNNTVGLDELSYPIADNSLQIYPNPIGFGQKLNWEAEENIESLSVYSMDGRLLQGFMNSAGEKSIDLNLAEGTYIIHANTDSGKYKVAKLMVSF